MTINNKHAFSKGKNGFQISPRLQELMVYAGQLDCYEKCNEVLEKFLNIEVSSAQVYRVTDTYGEQVGKEIDFTERALPPLKRDETLYVEADGSMIFTRDEQWKEVKVGRLFKSSDCIHADGKPGWIKHSQYTAQLGNSKDFTKQMDGLIESYGELGKRLVFISDGAPWIKNWIEDTFPNAISILDYYHALEHLYQFRDSFFTDIKIGKMWVKQQEKLLKNSKAAEIINNINQLSKNKEAQKLIAYYKSNEARMDYKRYRSIGCGIVGSGAIESAHRTVVQKRMKLSGQRWSKKGAQHMLNLRVVYMNNQWNKIIQLTKTEFKAAA